MEEKVQVMKQDLDDLLQWAYDRGQAYYRKDKFGSAEDEDMEWDACYEDDYQGQIRRFLDLYSVKNNLADYVIKNVSNGDEFRTSYHYELGDFVHGQADGCGIGIIVNKRYIDKSGQIVKEEQTGEWKRYHDLQDRLKR